MKWLFREIFCLQQSVTLEEHAAPQRTMPRIYLVLSLTWLMLGLILAWSVADITYVAGISVLIGASFWYSSPERKAHRLHVMRGRLHSYDPVVSAILPRRESDLLTWETWQELHTYVLILLLISVLFPYWTLPELSVPAILISLFMAIAWVILVGRWMQLYFVHLRHRHQWSETFNSGHKHE